ncbi:type I-C CRISPR-associated protein Cas5c [uncultured Acetatifactor sp.]|uniref:type I-C CRISPR-associated protein Cas5c n=1 Tax=uncultured Acetatifactor sp. TaxID=1671927 RepID=UPI002626E5D3|nr:type I-C CRISPR-associated protein Cas5c [uncultured Acetatifactor sp.]
MKNEITYRVWGRNALFTDPVTKIGGEKSSLQIPTPQSIKGVTESIYWKPSIIWVVDEIRIMKPILMEGKGIRPIGDRGNDLARYTYLKDVEYYVRAHFEFNRNRPDLSQDWNENKHYFIARRSLKAGGRRDIFLGTRECQAYVEPVDFDNGEGAYDDMDMDFGLQYHSIGYPDETGENQMIVRFWYPRMEKGRIKCCRPEACPKEHVVRKASMKQFSPGVNFSFAQEVM